MKTALIPVLAAALFSSLSAETAVSAVRQFTGGGNTVLRVYSLEEDDIMRERFRSFEYGNFGIKTLCAPQKKGTFSTLIGAVPVETIRAADSVSRRTSTDLGKAFVQFTTDIGNIYTVWDKSPADGKTLSIASALDSLAGVQKKRYVQEPEITDAPDTVAIANGNFPQLFFPAGQSSTLLESDEKIVPYIAAYLKQPTVSKVRITGTVPAGKKGSTAYREKFAKQLAVSVKNRLVQLGVEESKLILSGKTVSSKSASAFGFGSVRITAE